MDKKKARDVAVMAHRGSTEAERETAKRILESKGLSADDILSKEEETRNVYEKYSTKLEKQLILQTVSKLLNTRDLSYYQHRQRLRFIVPASQYLHIRESIEAIRTLWKSELETFLEAFVEANELYPADPCPKTDDEPLSVSDLKKIHRIQNISEWIKKTQFHNLICAKEEREWKGVE